MDIDIFLYFLLFFINFSSKYISNNFIIALAIPLSCYLSNYSILYGNSATRSFSLSPKISSNKSMHYVLSYPIYSIISYKVISVLIRGTNYFISFLTPFILNVLSMEFKDTQINFTLSPYLYTDCYWVSMSFIKDLIIKVLPIPKLPLTNRKSLSVSISRREMAP